MAKSPGKAFVPEDYASVLADADALITSGEGTLATVDGHIATIDDAGSDAQQHAQATAPFTDSTGADYDDGAKGYSHASRSHATGEGPDGEPAEGSSKTHATKSSRHRQTAENAAGEDDDYDVIDPDTGGATPSGISGAARSAEKALYRSMTAQEAASEEADYTAYDDDGTPATQGIPGAAYSASVATEEADRSHAEAERAERTLLGYPAREAVAAGAAAYALPPGTLTTVNAAPAGSFSALRAGFAVPVGQRPAGFDTVGIPALPDTSGTLTGVWVGVATRPGGTETTFSNLELVLDPVLYPVEDYQRDAPFDRGLPFPIYDAANPHYVLIFGFVGKTMQAPRTASGAGTGYWYQNAEGNPTGTTWTWVAGSGNLEVRLGLHALGGDGALRPRQAAVEAHERFTRGPTARSQKAVTDALARYFDLAPPAVSEVETFDYDDPDRSVSGLAVRAYYTPLDLSALAGADRALVAFQPTVAPATRLRIRGLTAIDGAPTFDVGKPITTTVGLMEQHDVLGDLKDALESAPNTTVVGFLTDELVKPLVKAEATTSYYGTVLAVGAEEPEALLDPTPNTTHVAWIRVEQSGKADGRTSGRSRLGIGEEVPAQTMGDAMERAWYAYWRARVAGETLKAFVHENKGNSLMSENAANRASVRHVEALGGATYGAAVAVTSATRSGQVVTVNATAHGHVTGDWTTIEGANQGAYNREAAVTVINANQLTFLLPLGSAPATPATGTITIKKRTGGYYPVHGRISASTGHASGHPVKRQLFDVERYDDGVTGWPALLDRLDYGSDAFLGRPGGADMYAAPMNQGNGYRISRYNYERLLLAFMEGPDLGPIRWRVDGGSWTTHVCDAAEIGRTYVEIGPLTPGSNHVIEFEGVDLLPFNERPIYLEGWSDRGDWREGGTPGGQVIADQSNQGSSSARQWAVFGDRAFALWADRPDVPPPDVVAWLVGDFGGEALESIPQLQLDLETLPSVTATAGRAAWAVAEGTLTVSSLTQAGGTATANTSAPHRLTTGDEVTVSGADQAGYNGTHTVTVTDADTFTFAVDAGTASPATGAVTAIDATAAASAVPPSLLCMLPHDAAEGSPYDRQHALYLRKEHVNGWRRSGELVDLWNVGAKLKNWPTGPWTNDSVHLNELAWDTNWRLVIPEVMARGLPLGSFSAWLTP